MSPLTLATARAAVTEAQARLDAQTHYVHYLDRLGLVDEADAAVEAGFGLAAEYYEAMVALNRIEEARPLMHEEGWLLAGVHES